MNAEISRKTAATPPMNLRRVPSDIFFFGGRGSRGRRGGRCRGDLDRRRRPEHLAGLRHGHSRTTGSSRSSTN